jgi:hypothetical protein
MDFVPIRGEHSLHWKGRWQKIILIPSRSPLRTKAKAIVLAGVRFRRAGAEKHLRLESSAICLGRAGFKPPERVDHRIDEHPTVHIVPLLGRRCQKPR